MIRILIIGIILLPLFSAAQQADDVLSRFFAARVNETVFLRWTITAGNTCEDTYIERSGDGINYERIGIIGGICGSPDQSMTYEFTDSVPIFNRVSYYRLVLGYYGFSSPKTIEIFNYNEEGFLLAPNPFSDFTRLSFENETKEEYILRIFDTRGTTVLELITTDNIFMIQRPGLASGLYVFTVSRNDKFQFGGKMLVN